MRFTLILLFLFASNFVQSQTTYQVIIDSTRLNERVYKGLIDKDVLKKDSSFTWFKTNYQLYTPDTSLMNKFLANGKSFHFLVFGGTWCEDTQFILPRFFKLLETSGIPDTQYTFFGVDRKKETTGNIATAFSIKNVPTIIVLQNGKEVGRVIEYGKTGKWDMELGEIMK
jgi:thiol-disulfide isomerase/thioredoxin